MYYSRVWLIYIVIKPNIYHFDSTIPVLGPVLNLFSSVFPCMFSFIHFMCVHVCTDMTMCYMYSYVHIHECLYTCNFMKISDLFLYFSVCTSHSVLFYIHVLHGPSISRLLI